MKAETIVSLSLLLCVAMSGCLSQTVPETDVMRTDYFEGTLEIEGEPTVDNDVLLKFSFRTDLLKPNETRPLNFSEIEVKFFADNVWLERINWSFVEMDKLEKGRQTVTTKMHVESEGDWKVGVYTRAILLGNNHDVRVYYIYGHSTENEARFSSESPYSGLEQTGRDL